MQKNKSIYAAIGGMRGFEEQYCFGQPLGSWQDERGYAERLDKQLTAFMTNVFDGTKVSGIRIP